jgi:hypothetical protein
LKTFEEHLLQSSKAAAIIAMALTAFCTLVVVGWQIELLLGGDGWPYLTVSQVLDTAETALPTTYTTASYEPGTGLAETATFSGWLLALPALVPLTLGLGLLALYYRYLKKVEEEFAGR